MFALIHIIPSDGLSLLEKRRFVGRTVISERHTCLPVGGHDAGADIVIDAANRFAEAGGERLERRCALCAVGRP